MTDLPQEMPDERIIPARSRREVMDWSLVLASQEIAATILRTESGWGLSVGGHDYGAAQRAIRQFVEENRGWRWKLGIPGSGMVFHYGALVWVVAMAGCYYWTTAAFPPLRAAGIMDVRRVEEGQWWRLFTAITLHESLTHLAENLGMGFLLLGLAMARYGPGVALLAAFLGGAAGNLAGLMVHSRESQSLGASGMIMAALGMLSVQSFSLWRRHRADGRAVMRTAAAGILILVLTGFEQGADMAAHLAGFAAGTVFGVGLNTVRPAALHRGGPNTAAVLALAALVIAAWRQASSSP